MAATEKTNHRGDLDLCIRRVRPWDLLRLYLWRNDSDTRKNSLNQERIGVVAHTSWFLKALFCRRQATLVVQGRFGPGMFVPMMICSIIPAKDANGTWVISVNLDPRFRGQGISSALVEVAVSEFAGRIADVRTIRALVRHHNAPSLRLFTRLGFQVTSEHITYVVLEKSVH